MVTSKCHQNDEGSTQIVVHISPSIFELKSENNSTSRHLSIIYYYFYMLIIVWVTCTASLGVSCFFVPTPKQLSFNSTLNLQIRLVNHLRKNLQKLVYYYLSHEESLLPLDVWPRLLVTITYNETTLLVLFLYSTFGFHTKALWNY